jgi:hypothetical protein
VGSSLLLAKVVPALVENLHETVALNEERFGPFAGARPLVVELDWCAFLEAEAEQKVEEVVSGDKRGAGSGGDHDHEDDDHDDWDDGSSSAKAAGLPDAHHASAQAAAQLRTLGPTDLIVSGPMRRKTGSLWHLEAFRPSRLSNTVFY